MKASLMIFSRMTGLYPGRSASDGRVGAVVLSVG